MCPRNNQELVAPPPVLRSVAESFTAIFFATYIPIRAFPEKTANADQHLGLIFMAVLWPETGNV